jgi:hypothetical protein
MDMSGQLQAPAALPSGKEPLVPIAWAQEPTFIHVVDYGSVCTYVHSLCCIPEILFMTHCGLRSM